MVSWLLVVVDLNLDFPSFLPSSLTKVLQLTASSSNEENQNGSVRNVEIFFEKGSSLLERDEGCCGSIKDSAARHQGVEGTVCYHHFKKNCSCSKRFRNSRCSGNLKDCAARHQVVEGIGLYYSFQKSC